MTTTFLKIRIIFKGFVFEELNSEVVFFFKLIKKGSFFFVLPKRLKKFILVKSPFIFGKHKEHFALTTYKVLVGFNLNFFLLARLWYMVGNFLNFKTLFFFSLSVGYPSISQISLTDLNALFFIHPPFSL
jgi:ribosomal protein S10